ncbi:unnamed protein product, partial [Toxocara canis]|uniref:Beta-lactamase domain-containing protein n=1 Tax=Toxocara canis TaxID=6265 RepID=A0A183U5N7_TOXCA
INAHLHGRDREQYCVAIWKKGRGARYRLQIDSHLPSMQHQMKNSQMSVTAISVLPTEQQTLFYIIWLGSNFSWHNRQIPITTTNSTSSYVDNSTSILSLLDAEIQRMMRIEQLPSLSIAVITNEGTRISKAYGFADIRQQRNATPFSKYRIASISKVITAMAIEKLIEKKLLKSINARVFGEGSILGTKYGQRSYNRFMEYVSVKHLLEHTTGSWGNQEKLEYERFEIFGLFRSLIGSHHFTFWLSGAKYGAVANRDYDHGDPLAQLDGKKRLAASAGTARSGNRRITSGNEKTSEGNDDGNDGRKGKLHKGIEVESETTDGKKSGVGPSNGSCSSSTPSFVC